MRIGAHQPLSLIHISSDVAEGASKANSGIVHAGFDAKPGTLKAKLNVEGARMYPALCAEVDAPYGQPGAMVLAFTEEDVYKRQPQSCPCR